MAGSERAFDVRLTTVLVWLAQSHSKSLTLIQTMERWGWSRAVSSRVLCRLEDMALVKRLRVAQSSYFNLTPEGAAEAVRRQLEEDEC